jgi:hypothetical protein
VVIVVVTTSTSARIRLPSRDGFGAGPNLPVGGRLSDEVDTWCLNDHG